MQRRATHSLGNVVAFCMTVRNQGSEKSGQRIPCVAESVARKLQPGRVSCYLEGDVSVKAERAQSAQLMVQVNATGLGRAHGQMLVITAIVIAEMNQFEPVGEREQVITRQTLGNTYVAVSDVVGKTERRHAMKEFAEIFELVTILRTVDQRNRDALLVGVFDQDG